MEIVNDYYDGPEELRVVIERDEEALSPRLGKDNLFLIETWDRVEGTPDYGLANEMSQHLNWSFTGPNHALAVNHRGSHHSYLRLDPKLATIIARWMVVFEGYAWAHPLSRSVDARLHLSTDDDTETVGIVHTRLESDVVLPKGLMFAVEAHYEIEQYNDWARGNVWKYVIEEKIECPCGGKHPGCDGADWIELPEAGCEIYGKEIVTSMAMEHLAGIYSRKALM